MTGADIAAIVERAVHVALRTTDGSSPDIARRDMRAAINGQLENDESDRRGYH
jgi:SpoVK/Ycf46/Vps4 family AAA+-type ATPase